MKRYMVKQMPRPETAIVERNENRPDKIYLRPEYEVWQGDFVVSWLNDRELGYPVPRQLQHLHNGH